MKYVITILKSSGAESVFMFTVDWAYSDSICDVCGETATDSSLLSRPIPNAEMEEWGLAEDIDKKIESQNYCCCKYFSFIMKCTETVRIS